MEEAERRDGLEYDPDDEEEVDESGSEVESGDEEY